MVLVSIIICTRNRAASLALTLESIDRISVPGDCSVEVVVVDNGSSDSTRSVVENAAMRIGPIRYVFEERAGKGFAFNTALEHSQGAVLLGTDDDVRPPTNWLEGMCRPIIDGTADAMVGGVRLAPHLERPWMKGDLRGWIACTDGLIDPHRPRLVGANMAFARRVIDRVPGYDPELGPGGLGFFDDTLFGNQIRQAGFRIGTALDVAVEHHPDVDRLGEGKLVDLARRLGRSSAYQYHHWEHGRIGFKRAKLMIYGVLRVWYGLWSMLGRDVLAARLNIEFQVSLIHGFMIEQGRQRNYEQWGLVKRGDQGTAKTRKALAQV